MHVERFWATDGARYRYVVFDPDVGSLATFNDADEAFDCLVQMRPQKERRAAKRAAQGAPRV